MRVTIICLFALAAALALAPGATAQWGTRPNDMHIDQNGYASPGSQVALTFRVTKTPNAGLGYQAAVSQSWKPGIPIPGVGTIPLFPDGFFFLSASNVLPQVFGGFAGKLDQNGTAAGSITVPPIPALDGVTLWMAFIIYDNTGIKGISRAQKFQVLDRPQTAAAGLPTVKKLEIYDLDGKSIVKSISIGTWPQSPFYDLSCKNILLADWGGLLIQVDTRTNTIQNSLKLSLGNNNCVGGTSVMTKSGERIFVCNANPATPSVVEVDPVAWKEVKTHSFPATGARPAGIAVRPFGSEAMVTCFLTNGALFKFDVETGAITSLVSLGGINNPQEAVWRPQGDYVFVAEYGGTTSTMTPTVWAYDYKFRLAKKINVGVKMPGPAGIAMSPDGSTFYCDAAGDSNIAKVDADPSSPGFGTVIKNIPLLTGWSSGGWMIRNYDGSKAYELLTNGFGELDTKSDTFSKTIVPTSSQAAIMNARHRQDL